MRYSPLPSLVRTKFIFKSFQLQEKTDLLLKNEIHVFHWLYLPKCHICSSGNRRSISLAHTKEHILSALRKKLWLCTEEIQHKAVTNGYYSARGCRAPYRDWWIMRLRRQEWVTKHSGALSIYQDGKQVFESGLDEMLLSHKKHLQWRAGRREMGLWKARGQYCLFQIWSRYLDLLVGCSPIYREMEHTKSEYFLSVVKEIQSWNRTNHKRCTDNPISRNTHLLTLTLKSWGDNFKIHLSTFMKLFLVWAFLTRFYLSDSQISLRLSAISENSWSEIWTLLTVM